MSRMPKIKTLSKEFEDEYDITGITSMIMELTGSKTEFGEISTVMVPLLNRDGLPLIMIPGYSYDSFETGARILMSGYHHLKTRYSCIYMVCWTDEIKTITSSTKDDNKKDEYKIIFAGILNKILHKLEIKKCSVIGKSAGGGISICLTSINPDVQYLYLACPALTRRGKPLEGREVPIKLMWCKDDDTLPYTIYKELLSDFDKQNKEYSFYSYNTGGHDLNPLFILEL